MGCGAGVMEVAPELPKDPMIAIHARIDSERALLKSVIPALANSKAQLRYLTVNVTKINMVNALLSQRHNKEKALNDDLDDYIAYRDATEIEKACEGIGADQKKIANVICNRHEESVINIAAQYQRDKGVSLESLLKGNGKTLLGMLLTNQMTDVGQFIMYRIMSPARRDAYILKDCMDGIGAANYILIPILTYRTNEELKLIAKAYSQEFNDNMLQRIMSETGGMTEQNYGDWIDCLVSCTRDETEIVAPNVKQIAAQLYEAGAAKMVGCDKEVFKRHLCRANDVTCRAIIQEYQNLHNRSLLDDINKKFGGNLKMALVARLTPRLDFYAKSIFKACKGWGTNKSSLTSTLGSLTNHEVQLMSERYNEIFREKKVPYNDIRKTVQGEWLNAEFKLAFLSLLDCQSPKGHWVAKSTYQGEAANAAAHFTQYVQSTYNPGEAIHKGGLPLDGPLELPGQLEIFINTGLNTPYKDSMPVYPPLMIDNEQHLFFSTPLDINAGSNLLTQLAATRSGIDAEAQTVNMAIQGMFNGLYQRATEMRRMDYLLKRYKDDNVALLAFCSERDAKLVRNAIEGWGTDKDTLITVLCALTKQQLRQVDAVYKRDYRKSLQQELDGELAGLWGNSGHFKYFMHVLLTPDAEMDAELVKDSMEGFGTDESLLTEIVCTRSSKELKEADRFFIDKHGRNIAKWVSLDTSGTYQRFLVRCLQGDCDEGLVDAPLSQIQAKAINDGINATEPDEGKVFTVLAQACPDQLAWIQQTYRQQYGADMILDIEDKMGGMFKGDFTKALKAKCTNKYDFLAASLEKAFKGLGTDEFAVTRIIARYPREEVMKISDAFIKKTGESLKSALTRETSSNYQKALLSYLYSRTAPEGSP